jgi:hypothetical protein
LNKWLPAAAIKIETNLFFIFFAFLTLAKYTNLREKINKLCDKIFNIKTKKSINNCDFRFQVVA